ncbi:hypothetical protein [Phormidium nigroviride]
MRKFSFLVAISLLALWTGGCGSDSGNNQASPTPSPAPSGASPSPVAGATGSPSATPSPTFASPLVTPKSTGTTAAIGLIQSTNPDERARQALSGAGNNNRSQLPSPPISQAPLQTDPFSVLPPQTVQNLPVPTQGVNGASTGSSLPKLPDRQVASLPTLPVLIGPPPVLPKAIPPVLPLSSNKPQEKALGRELISLPTVPRQAPSPLLGSSSRGLSSLPRGSSAGTSTVPQLPELNPPPLGIRRAPGLGTGGPLPPIPVAARPLGVPDLPELPVDKRPPQWVDPNPPRQRPGPAIPPPPDTGIASGIEVSGVVKVGNEIQVIVKVPTEATSRYVKVGQRLGNGQVLVKRVDIKPGQDPVVFLEQSGVEIAKVVGEKPVKSDPNLNNTIVRKPGTSNRLTQR